MIGYEILERRDEKDQIGSLRIKLGDFEKLKDLNAIYPKVVKYLKFFLEMSKTLACLLFHLLFSRFTPSHSPHLLHLNFSQVLANFQVSLRIKVGSFNFSTFFFMILLRNWIEKNMRNLRYHLFSMNSSSFMFNWYVLSENWKHDQVYMK